MSGGYVSTTQARNERAIAEEWCNGCGQPRRSWGPICPGMTQGDFTHYHSREWWLARQPDPYAERCGLCEGLDYPGLMHNPNAPYCSSALETEEAV